MVIEPLNINERINRKNSPVMFIAQNISHGPSRSNSSHNSPKNQKSKSTVPSAFDKNPTNKNADIAVVSSKFLPEIVT